MTKEPDSRLVLGAGHFPATLCAISACLNAFIHAIEFLTAQCACLTDFGANLANTTMKSRVNEQKIGRCLADLGAADHETEMFCFNMLSASLEAVVHGACQADLMTMAARLDTGLHGVFRGGMGLMFHGASPVVKE